MSPDRLEMMFGIPNAKRVAQRWADKHKIKNVAVWSRGKGCEQLLNVLDFAGVCINAVYDEASMVNQHELWRQIPLREQEQFNPENVDGLVVGSLSPGVAEDLQDMLSCRYPQIEVLSAAPWCVDATKSTAVAV